MADDRLPFFRRATARVGEIDLVVEPCLAEITDIAVLRQKFVSGTISASLIPTKKITKNKLLFLGYTRTTVTVLPRHEFCP